MITSFASQSDKLWEQIIKLIYKELQIQRKNDLKYEKPIGVDVSKSKMMMMTMIDYVLL
jgi:hypothetical protein